MSRITRQQTHETILHQRKSGLLYQSQPSVFFARALSSLLLLDSFVVALSQRVEDGQHEEDDHCQDELFEDPAQQTRFLETNIVKVDSRTLITNSGWWPILLTIYFRDVYLFTHSSPCLNASYIIIVKNSYQMGIYLSIQGPQSKILYSCWLYRS